MEKRVEMGVRVGRRAGCRCDECSSSRISEYRVKHSPLSHPGAMIFSAYSGGHF